MTETNYCSHERERLSPTPRNLHELMMLEAEPIIQHNWTDVAIHDKNKLMTVPVGHTCVWIVGSTGSYLSPMYCQISDAAKWQETPNAIFAPIVSLLARWHDEYNCRYNLKFNPLDDKHFYLVEKGEDGQGTVTSVEKKSFMRFCMCSEFEWTDYGFLPCLTK
jgi:hypothetical protein